MDPRIEQWQRQAQEAIAARPEKKDAIEARFREMVSGLSADWAQKAQEAVDGGAPRDKVQGRFKSLMEDNGFQLGEGFDYGSLFKQQPAAQFRDVQVGGSSTADPSYESAKFEGETPEEFADRMARNQRDSTIPASQQEREGAQMGQAGAFKSGMEQMAVRTAKGLGVDINKPSPVFGEDEQGKRISQGLGSFVAAAPALLNPATVLGFGATQGSAGYQEAKDAGASTEGAALAGVVEGASYPLLRFVPGALGKSIVTKALTGVGINEATGIGLDATLNAVTPDSLHRDLLDPTSRILDAISGGIGGAMHVKPAGREAPPIIPTGDAAFDAGKASVAVPEGANFSTKIDLNQGFEQKFPTIKREAPTYGKIPETTVNVDGIETGRVDATPPTREDLMSEAANSVGSKEAKATQREMADYTKQARETQAELDALPEHKALARELEDSYLEDDLRVHGEEGAFSPELTKLRQDSADAEAGRQLGEKKAALTSQLETVSDRLQRTEAEAARQAGGQAALDKLRAVERRDGKPEQIAPVQEIPDVSGVAAKTAFPSQEGVAVSATEQPKVQYPIQGKSIKLAKIKEGAPATTKLEATPKELSVDDLRKHLDNAQAEDMLFSAIPDNGGKVLASAAPPHIMEKLKAGTLTVKDVLDHGSKSLETDHPLTKQASNLARYLGALSDRIGGKDVKFTVLDKNNLAHAKILAEDPNLQGGKFAGFYHPGTNQIYLQPHSGSATTMLHEAAHGIASKMLYMGKKDLLTGPAKTAFTEMNDVFTKLVQPELTKRLGNYEEGVPRLAREYGLTNIDEFYSELFSNGLFRKSLKEMELTPEVVSSLPKEVRGLVGRAKNLYQLATRALSKMMGRAGIRSFADVGVGEKATNAYDLMFSHMDRLHNAIDDKTASSLRQASTRNTGDNVADMSFLGERVPLRAPAVEAAPKESLNKPRSNIVSALKAGFLGRGVEPLITQAKETLSGPKKAAHIDEITATNKSIKLLKKMSPLTRDRVIELQTIYQKDISTPEAVKAIQELAAINPEMASLTRELAVNSYENSIAIGEALLESQVGKDKPDAKIANMYQKIMDNRWKYSPIIYDSKAATIRRHASALRAEKKLADGKLLSKEERSDLTAYNNLLAYIGDTTYGDKAALMELRHSQLTELVRGIAGDEGAKAYALLPRKVAKEAMATRLADYNAKLENRPEAIREMAAKISGVGNVADQVMNYFSGLKYDSSTLKSIEHVSEPIRTWWGEVHNPMMKLIEGNLRQKLQLSEIKTLNRLREQGMGTLFTEQPGKGMTVKLTGKSLGALEGLHTTPDIAKLIGDVADFNTKSTGLLDSLISGKDIGDTTLKGIDKALWAWVQTTRATKTATTVGNIGAWWRNAEGSVMQTVSNGNTDPRTYAQGLKAMRGLVGISQKTHITPESRLMVEMDLAEASQAADTYSIKNRHTKDILRSIVDEHPEASPSTIRRYAQAALDKAGASVDAAKEVYGALDLWTKFANFYNEKNVWADYNKRNNIKMSEDELNRFVADRIKQTNISYSRSPKVLQMFERLGGTKFANYYYEVFRTSANNVGVAVQDISKGIKEGDTQLVAHGTKRLAGTTAAVGYATVMYSAVTKATLAALGYTAATAADKDAVEEYVKDNSFQDPESTSYFVDKKSGEVYGFDTAMIGPYDPMTSVLLPVGKAMADPENADKYLKEATKSVTDFMSPNSAILGLMKVAQGRSPSIKKTDPKTYEYLRDLGVEKGGLSIETMDRFINGLDVFTPKTIKEVARGVNSDADVGTKAAIASGLGVYKLNPKDDIKNYLAGSFKNELYNAKKPYVDLLKSNVNISEERLDKEFTKAMEAIAKPYGKLVQASKASMAMGKSEDDVYDTLKSSRLDKEVINSILDGEMYPARIVYTDMKAVADEQIAAETDEVKQDKLADEWDIKLERLNLLMDKYEDLTLEQLQKGATSAK